jgi:hypothetical protein
VLTAAVVVSPPGWCTWRTGYRSTVHIMRHELMIIHALTMMSCTARNVLMQFRVVFAVCFIIAILDFYPCQDHLQNLLPVLLTSCRTCLACIMYTKSQILWIPCQCHCYHSLSIHFLLPRIFRIGIMYIEKLRMRFRPSYKETGSLSTLIQW